VPTDVMYLQYCPHTLILQRNNMRLEQEVTIFCSAHAMETGHCPEPEWAGGVRRATTSPAVVWTCGD